MSEEQDEPITITDKRGMGTRQSASVVPPEEMTPEQIADMHRLMREQAEAAQAEEKSEVGMRCAAFVIVSIDHNGLMHLTHKSDELAQAINQGIQPEREATSTDISNMASQLQVMVTGSEVASRVMEALQMQAQLTMARAAGARIGRVGG